MFLVLDVLSGVPMRLEISKYERTLLLIFAKILVNLKSIALMVWSLFSFPRDLISKGGLSPPCEEY